MDRKPIAVAIHGAAGRMGQRLIALGSSDPDVAICAALERTGHQQLGEDAGLLAGVGTLNVKLADSLTTRPDVVIDFSTPEGAQSISQRCQDQQIPLVMATTGLSPDQQQMLRQVAQSTAVVWSPNMSLAVNLVMKLAAMSARALSRHGAEVDVEIIERHHRFKEDAPSGTALRLGEMIAEQMGQTRHVHGRHGRPGRRSPDEIGYHALRVADNPGEHTVVFGMLGEAIELTVRASSRDSYAAGALAAAKFVAGKPPGLYSMFDVLNL